MRRIPSLRLRNANESFARSHEFRRMIAAFSVVIALVLAVNHLQSFRLEHGFLRDAEGQVLAIDFVNSWMIGRAITQDDEPGRNYDIAAYTDRVRALLNDPHYPYQQQAYPPSYALLMAPFGLLSAMHAWLLAAVISGLMFIGAMRLLQPDGWQRNALILIACPAALMAYQSGQLSLLFAGLQIAAFAQMERRPWLSGVLLGLVSVKPTLGLFYPLFLLATRRYQTFFGAVLTTLVLAAASALLGGIDFWRAYIEQGMPLQHEYVLKHTPFSILTQMVTVYMDLKLVGMPHVLAMLGQGMTVLVVLGLILHPSFRAMQPASLMLAAAAGNILMTPFLMGYDLVFFSAAILIFVNQNALSRLGFGMLTICFLLPILHSTLGSLHLGGTAFFPLLLMVWLQAYALRENGVPDRTKKS